MPLCQWEALERDLADALRAPEPVLLRPRRSALRLSPSEDTCRPPPHFLGLEPHFGSRPACRRWVSRSLGPPRPERREAVSPQSVGADEDMVGHVPDEEAPLRPRVRSLAQLAPACRRAALAWQLPGLASHPLWATAPLPDRLRLVPALSAEALPRRTEEASAPWEVDLPMTYGPSIAIGHLLRGSASLREASADTVLGGGMGPSRRAAGRARSQRSIRRDVATPRMWHQVRPGAYERISAVTVVSQFSPGPRTPAQPATAAHPAEGEAANAHTCVATSRGGIYDECAVCMEAFDRGEWMRTLLCAHRYHVSCIDPWLLTRRSCPLCKAEV